MKKIIKNILIGTSITAVGITTTKNSWAGLLYHDYKIKTYYEKNDKKRENQDFLVLFHGIYGKSSDMENIAQYFKNDYRIVNIQYPTTKETAQEITELYIKPSIENIIGEIYAQNFHNKIENQYFEIDENGNRKNRQAADKNLNQNIKINFVTHSMGTGILRYYLKENPLKNLGKVVFISPPSHGSHLADIPFVDKLPFILGKVVPQFSTKKDSFVNQLKEPDYNCYVMVGNRANNPLYSVITDGESDGAVPVKSAKLENCKFKIIDGESHSSILKSDKVMQEILKYFKE